MDSKNFTGLEDAYKLIYSESKKDESPEKEEEDRKKDDDLFGSPNKNGNGKNGKNGDDDKNGKNGKKKAKRWWDDDGDGKGYEKGEVKEDMNKGYVVTAADKKGNTPAWQGYKAGAKKKDGSPLYRAADHIKEEELQEKQKDTPLQVAAVIDKDRAKKATDDATYDRMHGKNKKADEDERYSKWERYKMKRDAQRAGHPWEHAKGSTTEKEGKKSEKAKRVYDPEHNKEETLWDVIADALTELHEVGGVQFKVVPLNEKEEKDWIQGAVKRPGAFTKKAKAHDMPVQKFAKYVDDHPDKFDTRTKRQANLAQTFASMKKEGADIQALANFFINEGADEEAVNHVLANWVVTKEDYWMEFEEGYQRNPEKGEAEERKAERDRKASGRMPPRGDKRREEFERWYAANVR